MPEHFSLHQHNTSRPPVEVLFEPGERARFVETPVQPGGQYEMRPLYIGQQEPRVTAYIRTSALARGGVNVLQLEDIRGVPAEEDGTKRVHDRSVPKGTKYLLVDVDRQEGRETEVPGFVSLAKGEPYEYGRATKAVKDFTMDSGTSRRHFSITVGDGGDVIVLQDLGSTSGLGVLEWMDVAADGTPVRHPGDLHFDGHDLGAIDRKLQAIDAANATGEQKRAARELLAAGTFNGVSTDYRPGMRSSGNALMSREFMSAMALRDLEVAKTFVEKEIVGIHGTRSIALLGMMERGMQSASALRRAGQPVVSGEHIYHYDDGQINTSFSTPAGYRRVLSDYAGKHQEHVRSITEVQSTLMEMAEFASQRIPQVSGRRQGVYEAIAHDNRLAAEYIERQPDSLFAQMLRHDFPVIIGVNRAEVERQRTELHTNLLEGAKELAEFRLDTTEAVPMEAFPVVAVPHHYVKWVQELMHYFGHDSVTVVSLEALPQERI